MWEDGERAFTAFASEHGAELRRQAYLLTGDRATAESLARHALTAAHLQFRQSGGAGVAEFARAELVRSFVADSYTDRRPALAGGHDQHDQHDQAGRAGHAG